MRDKAQGMAFLTNSETGGWDGQLLPNSETGDGRKRAQQWNGLRRRDKPATESTVAQGRTVLNQQWNGK